MRARPTLVDRVVGYFNPKAGLRRAHARLQHEVFQEGLRKFEGASVGKRTGAWNARGTSANAEARGAINILRNRARDLDANNPYAKRGCDELANNIVGPGIIPQIRSSDETAKAVLSKLWAEWADTPLCSVGERNSLYGLQHLGERARVSSGEVIFRRRYRQISDRFALPLQIEMLESDFIDTWKEGDLDDGGFIIQGVEFDRFGRRRAYWLFEKHPGDAGLLRQTSYSYVSKRVPAEDIIHHFRVDRPGQVRGITDLATCLIKFKDHGDFTDYTLLRTKYAAAFSAFVYDNEPPDEFNAPSAEGSDSPTKSMTLEAGSAQFLPPGKNIVFPNLPSAPGLLDLNTVSLAAIAAGLGVTYERLTGDYSHVNFSSSRMGELNFRRRVDTARWLMQIPHVSVGLFNWFLEAALLAGYPADKVYATWTPPKWEMIDVTAETNAAVIQIRAGLKTLPEYHRENGEDSDEVLKEIAETNAKIDKLKLVLDSDARYTMKAGIIQPTKIEADKATTGDANAP